MRETIYKILEKIKENYHHPLREHYKKPLGFSAIGLLLLLVFYYALRPQPIPVDWALIEKGEMQVTIKEEGETRVRDIYIVSSPIAGHLARTNLDEGEEVKANVTTIASIHPLDPPFLDERRLLELNAVADAANSAVALAEADHQSALLKLELAEKEYQRSLKLSKNNVVSSQRLETVQNEAEIAKSLVESTRAKVDFAKSEYKSALARLKQPTSESQHNLGKTCCIKLASPIDGVVLRVHARSQQAVQPGTKIAEVGNPKNLEIIVDLISSDAPKLKRDAKILISKWGGGKTLTAHLRRVEPGAFTKVSSLGIEEQRVNAIMDLETVPDSLGHGYRVVVEMVIWSKADVKKIPISALFRTHGKWSAFFLNDGRAVLKDLKIGQMNENYAEVIQGAEEGETVILYPNDQIMDRSRVERRR